MDLEKILNKLDELKSGKNKMISDLKSDTDLQLSNELSEWPRQLYEYNELEFRVNFYDYDGAVLYSYLNYEFLGLDEMPPLPSQPGLICQGWNWSLKDAQEYVGKYSTLNIGATYTTDDGTTRLHIDTEYDFTRVKLNFSQTISDGVIINWGDGSSETVSGADKISSSHVYSTKGEYTISLLVAENCELTLGHNSQSYPVLGVTGAFLEEANFGSNVNTSQYAFYNSGIKRISLPNHVTSIGANAFYHCHSLQSVTIPNHVTSIGANTFSYCRSLQSITIPDSVTYFLENAFLKCSSLQSITIPDSVTSIGSQDFLSCHSLQSITIPNSVTEIGDSAFSGCRSLQSITIPESIKRINNSVFSACTSLQSITIPDSVTVIGESAFNGCDSLQSITIPDSVMVISSSAFKGCDPLRSITIPNGVTSISSSTFSGCYSLRSITIPDSVISIDANAFYNCASLQSITIPDSVTSIGNSAFYQCTSLQNVIIGNSVTTIGNYAFNNCASLQSITIPDGVTSIGTYAFQHCTSLQNAIIGNSVTSIGNSAFYQCTSLQNVIIGNSVTTIGNYAFNNCASLQSITIPNSVTSIGTYAFQHCTSLQNAIIGNSVTTIDAYTFNNCDSLQNVVIGNSVTSIGESAFESCNSLQSITIPNSVTSIGKSAFSGCTSLQSITLPDSITEISERLVWKCTSLQSITIPNPVTSIGVSAFSDCKSLQGITIPSGVTSIGTNAFAVCTSLQYIDFTSHTSIPTLGNDVFYNVLSSFEIRVPASLYYDWCDTVKWIDYKNNIKHGLMNSTDLTYNSLSITAADNVNGRKDNTTVYYIANVTGTNTWTYNAETADIRGVGISNSFPQNTSTTDAVERTITFELGGLTATIAITQGTWVDYEYEIILNNQWQLSPKPNPDSSLYDGVYESFSNYHVTNGYATMYIDIVGYETFKLYIRSYANSTQDYIMVSQLDQNIKGNTSYSDTTLVKAHTRGKQQSGTALSNYTLVEFTGIDKGEHRITIVYRKSTSGSNVGDDRGYIFTEKWWI